MACLAGGMECMCFISLSCIEIPNGKTTKIVPPFEWRHDNKTIVYGGADERLRRHFILIPFTE